MTNNNPYYNPQLSQSGWSDFLSGAQSVGAAGMGSGNPYAMAAGATISTVATPLQNIAAERQKYEQIQSAGGPEEQFDESGYQEYTGGEHESSLRDLEEDYDERWNDHTGGMSFGEYINPMNIGERYMQTARYGLNKLGLSKEADEQADILAAQREGLDSYNQNLTSNNMQVTNRLNRQRQSNLDRQRRRSNLNRLNVY